MTKKDYILLARVIKKSSGKSYAICELVKELCEELKKDNSKFDSDRFLTACGL